MTVVSHHEDLNGRFTDVRYTLPDGHASTARLRGHLAPRDAFARLTAFRTRWERDPANPNNRKGH